MFFWNDDTVRWMRNAAEFRTCQYHETLAQRISEYMEHTATVCDAGCGLGYLSIALSNYVEQVVAVDLSEKAIDHLKGTIARKSIGNIQPIVADMEVFCPEKKYDGAVFCFYGQIVQELLQTAKRICNGTVAYIKPNAHQHRISDGMKRIEVIEDAEIRLNRLGIPYRKEVHTLEYGQPFETIEDAEAFFQTYQKRADSESLRDLQTVEEAPFHYYYPYQREIGLLIFQTKDIPDNI